MYRHQTWGRASYTVPAGTYNVTARSISKEFTRNGLTYRAEYTATASPASVTVPAGGTASATATYTATPGTFCDLTGCRSVLPGVQTLPRQGVYSTQGEENQFSTDMEGGVTIIDTIVTKDTQFFGYDPEVYAVSSGATVRAQGSLSRFLRTFVSFTRVKRVNGNYAGTLVAQATFIGYIYCGGSSWKWNGTRTINYLTGEELENHPEGDPCRPQP